MPVDLKCKIPQLRYTEDDVHKILSDYGRTLADLEVYIQNIKDWFLTQPHIAKMPDDRIIVSFLLMNKFSVEKTKCRLEMSYSIRNLMPQYFVYTPMHPKIVQSYEFIKIVCVDMLTKDSRRISVVKYERADNVDMTAFIVRIIFGNELMAMYDFSKGEEYIIDCTNLTLSMISKISPTDIKRLVIVLDKVYANRFNTIHLVKLPSGGDTLVNMIKSFMKPKLRDRIILHKSADTLKDYYPEEMLPKEYGGSYKSVDEASNEIKQSIESHEEHFLKWIEISVDGKLRPEPLANDDILGYHGNFKKLDVD